MRMCRSVIDLYLDLYRFYFDIDSNEKWNITTDKITNLGQISTFHEVSTETCLKIGDTLNFRERSHTMQGADYIRCVAVLLQKQTKAEIKHVSK